MAERALPRLDYIGDVVVGVVSDCWCQKVIPECAPGDMVVYCEHPHESHDIVPPRTEDELPEGVDFGDYKRWCRMFAAAPELLAACKAIHAALRRYGHQVHDLFGHDEDFANALGMVTEAIAQAEKE